MSNKKINIGNNGKVVVKWKVTPSNYSNESEKKIISDFAKKYNISKDNVRVEPVFINQNGGNEITAENFSSIENIQNPEFQRELFKKYIKENNIENIDFDQIVEIDELINSKINYEVFEKNRRYTLKYLKWKNFMSYGDDNFFDFTNLKDLVLLTSEPANQGGKTTFCLDLFRFLLFGKVTDRDTDWTLSRVFNDFLPEATECVVEGCIEIGGEDYVIRRTITRPALKKRTPKSKTPQTISYYRLVNGEYVELLDEDSKNIEHQEEQTVRETNKVIKEAIGNTEDFDLMICVDADNLKSLISLKDSDRGRLISRWVGLLPLEKKDEITRETYNKVILPSMVLTRFNKDDLSEQIQQLTETNKAKNEENIIHEENKKKSEKRIQDLETEKNALLTSIQKIDDSLTKIDIVTLENNIGNLKQSGINKKVELENLEKEFKSFGDIDYNENHYQEIIELDKNKTIELNNISNEYRIISKEIQDLKNSEFCPTCGAKLKGVDNTQKIKEREDKLEELTNKGKELRKLIEDISKEKSSLLEKRKLVNTKNQLEIKISACKVQLTDLRQKYSDSVRLHNDIEKNKTAIEQNNKITTSLNVINENLKVENNIIKTLLSTISSNNTIIEQNNKSINELNKTVEKINKEEKIKRHWEVYKEMVGKKGISKLVLRTVLPLINGELKRLLGDVCDFNVEVIIDDSNDVAFNLIKDGVSKNLGSGSGFEKTVASLALRSVLGKISTFSKPSFVIFDEVLGGVSETNYDNVKLLFDKIVKDYQCILFITHNSVFKEWANTIVTIKKENNISKIIS